jgi:CheY-like chemotaxis protein
MGAMRKPLILCIDDECNGLEGRKMLLEESGYQVLVAQCGADGLELFATNSVDLVLLDYHMPQMSGDVVAEHMKASRADVPVVMLSGNDQLPESALRAVDAFVSKSQTPASLLETVQRLLSLHGQLVPVGSSDNYMPRRQVA